MSATAARRFLLGARGWEYHALTLKMELEWMKKKSSYRSPVCAHELRMPRKSLFFRQSPRR